VSVTVSRPSQPPPFSGVSTLVRMATVQVVATSNSIELPRLSVTPPPSPKLPAAADRVRDLVRARVAATLTPMASRSELSRPSPPNASAPAARSSCAPMLNRAALLVLRPNEPPPWTMLPCMISATTRPSVDSGSATSAIRSGFHVISSSAGARRPGSSPPIRRLAERTDGTLTIRPSSEATAGNPPRISESSRSWV
jgi:hypothetical protein